MYSHPYPITGQLTVANVAFIAAQVCKAERKRALRSLAIATVFACVIFQAAHARAQVFTDFTTIDTTTNNASGSIGPVAVTFSGTDVSGGFTDNGFTGFGYPFFAPPLPTSDSVNFTAFQNVNFAYTISFDSAVTDPRLHLFSLASVLDFGTIPLTKLSGQDFFFVSGSTVVGALGDGPPSDANGTVQLNGTFTSVNFTATTVAGVSGDEIVLQIGVVPEPSAACTLLLAVGFTAARRVRRR